MSPPHPLSSPKEEPSIATQGANPSALPIEKPNREISLLKESNIDCTRNLRMGTSNMGEV